jgi:small subunit ribosomal protein S1
VTENENLPIAASGDAQPDPAVAEQAAPPHALAELVGQAHGHELAIVQHGSALALPDVAHALLPSAPAHAEAPSADPIGEAVAPEPSAAEVLGTESIAAETAPVAPHKSGAPRTVGFDPSVEERKQRVELHWQHVSGSLQSGETLHGTVTTAVKGGLLVDVGGVRGFLPASQTRLEVGAALESLLKTKVPLRVIDVDQKRHRIVVSQRRALDDERRAKRTELLRSLKIGQKHEGVVVRLVPFGAFVDIGGVEGLVPMSELAFDRVEKVEDVLKVGERIGVTVLRIEEGGRKIGLSRKNALPDPIRDHAALLRPGNVLQGKVVAKDPRLEVEIAPGLVGSVRESDADPADYALGEAIEVSVRYVDRRNRRVVLTTLHGAASAAPRSTGFAPLGEELRRR